MVKLWVAPLQATALNVYTGVTVTVPLIGLAPALVAVKLAMLTYNMGLTTCGFLGMYLAWTLRMADGRHLTLLMLPVVAKAAIHIVLYADLRYQLPIMSFVMLFAAFALWHLRCVVRDVVPAPA